MMNRKLAQGRHVEGIRTASECVRTCHAELVQPDQYSILSESNGTLEKTFRVPLTTLADLAYEGLWPHVA